MLLPCRGSGAQGRRAVPGYGVSELHSNIAAVGALAASKNRELVAACQSCQEGLHQVSTMMPCSSTWQTSFNTQHMCFVEMAYISTAQAHCGLDLPIHVCLSSVFGNKNEVLMPVC